MLDDRLEAAYRLKSSSFQKENHNSSNLIEFSLVDVQLTEAEMREDEVGIEGRGLVVVLQTRETSYAY